MSRNGMLHREKVEPMGACVLRCGTAWYETKKRMFGSCQLTLFAETDAKTESSSLIKYEYYRQ